MAEAVGDFDAVEPGFDAAEAGCHDLGTPFDLAVALTEHAEWLVARGHGDTARPRRTEAREILKSLQARPWLERVGPLAAEESVSA